MHLLSPGLSPIVNLSPIIDKTINRDDDVDNYSNDDFDDDDENDDSHHDDIHIEQSIIINQKEQSNKNDPNNISHSYTSSSSIFIHQNDLSLLSTSSYLNTIVAKCKGNVNTTNIKEDDDSLRYISHLNMSDIHTNDNNDNHENNDNNDNYNDSSNDNNKNHKNNDDNNNDSSSLMMMSYLPDMTNNSDYDHVNTDINTNTAKSVPFNDHINHNSNANYTQTRINAIPLQFGISYSLNLDDNGLVISSRISIITTPTTASTTTSTITSITPNTYTKLST